MKKIHELEKENPGKKNVANGAKNGGAAKTGSANSKGNAVTIVDDLESEIESALSELNFEEIDASTER